MNFIPDRLVFRCNGCGSKFETPNECNSCGTSLCPECGRAGCLVNIIEMGRMVSHSVTLKSQMKRKGSNKPRKNPQEKIAALMKLTE